MFNITTIVFDWPSPPFKRFFLSAHPPDRLCGPPSLLCSGYLKV